MGSMAQPKRVGEYVGHELHVLELPDLAAWPRELVDIDSREFVLFVAADARGVSDDLVKEAARRAIASGMCYLVAWGPDCERVHDLFDRVIVDEHSRGAETVENVIMTTWHAHDSLDDALRYFLDAATPAEDYRAACRTWLAVSVGSDEWAVQIERALADPTAFIGADEDDADDSAET